MNTNLKMTNAELEILAKARMLFGEHVVVVSQPDWNGGRQNYCYSEYDSDDLRDFEYIEWSGSTYKFVMENPLFIDHYDTDHFAGRQHPEDEEWDAHNLILCYWNNAKNRHIGPFKD